VARVTLGWVSELDFGQRDNLGLDDRGNFHQTANGCFFGGIQIGMVILKPIMCGQIDCLAEIQNKKIMGHIIAAIIQQWHFGGLRLKITTYINKAPPVRFERTTY
jgi:hypothetical protein